MNAARKERKKERWNALEALKRAVVAGATRQYERLVAVALAAGATDDEIDQMAHQAVQELLTAAEEPLTAHDLMVASNGGYPRR